MMEEIDEEQRHFANVIATFKSYASYSLTANNRRRKDLFTLPLADQKLLKELGYMKKLEETDKAILENAKFLDLIVNDPEIFGHDLGDEDGNEDVQEGSSSSAGRGGHSHNHEGQQHSHSHSHSHSHEHEHDHDHSQQSRGNRRKKYRPTEFDMDKLRSTLKQFVRDWSVEGKVERDACYKPMTDALLNHFSDIPEAERRSFRILVPGSGLGRLAYDVASLGFACQGNEFSHYMLLSSFLMLNKTNAINQYTIYPYVHSFSNLPNKQAILRPISIPDVLPGGLPKGSDFSLVAGDFEEIYGQDSDPNEPQSGLWDGILTCFFVDTAKNIVNYLRIIHRILAPGGVWINLGPLLWHWENNNTNDPSIELDLEEVKSLARTIGFEISNERTIDTTYTNSSESMLGYVYHAAFWTATKIL